jgi:hypothetical protein
VTWPFGKALSETWKSIFPQVRDAVSDGALTVDILYRDHEGGQRTISRFSFIRRDADGEGGDLEWWSALSRHHALDED